MRTLTATAIVMVVAVAVGSCGSGASGIGKTASGRLTPEVQQVRAAVADGDPVGAAAKLAELRRTVAELRQRGDLTVDGASTVLAAAAEVEAGMGAVPSTGQPPRASSTSSPATSGRGGAGGTPTTSNDKGKGKGKGGQGGGD